MKKVIFKYSLEDYRIIYGLFIKKLWLINIVAPICDGHLSHLVIKRIT